MIDILLILVITDRGVGLGLKYQEIERSKSYSSDFCRYLRRLL